MTELKKYIQNCIAGVLISLVWSLFLGIGVIPFALFGWFMGDVAKALWYMRNLCIQNIQDTMYYISYTWEQTSVNIFVSYECPDAIIPQNKLFYFFKHDISTEHLGFRFLWWYVSYIEFFYYESEPKTIRFE